MKTNDIGNDDREVEEEYVYGFEGHGRFGFSLNMMGSHWRHLTREGVTWPDKVRQDHSSCCVANKRGVILSGTRLEKGGQLGNYCKSRTEMECD